MAVLSTLIIFAPTCINAPLPHSTQEEDADKEAEEEEDEEEAPAAKVAKVYSTHFGLHLGLGFRVSTPTISNPFSNHPYRSRLRQPPSAHWCHSPLAAPRRRRTPR